MDDNYFVNKNGEIEERYPFCKHCGSKKVIKKDFNWRILYLESGLAVKVKIKRYECTIVKENVNQNSLSHYKINTAIFQIILKIKQKNYSNMDGNH